MKQLIRVTVAVMILMLATSCSVFSPKKVRKYPTILKTQIEKKRDSMVQCVNGFVDKEVAPLEAKEICVEIYTPFYKQGK